MNFRRSPCSTGCAFCLTISLAPAIIIGRKRSVSGVLMERMRSSDMYVRLYPVLVKTRECCVERILIRPEEVRIILYKPMNREYRFEFEAHGLDNVDRPAALRALAQAIALDIPDLADPGKYYFSTHTAPRDGGGSYHWYEYAVQIAYKDQMLRAWYDHAEPEDGIIR